jgi:hypothetical protein
MSGRCRHLLADNVEELPPVALDLIRRLIEEADSALIVYDHEEASSSIWRPIPRLPWRCRTTASES